MPAVSVIVPCYNAAEFVHEALDSLIDQTFSDWECLVVDDCSTDGSAAVLKAYAERDPRFVPILLPENGGASAARNAGLAAATGSFITLLDADDAYAPDRLARMMALIEQTGADLVFDNQAISDYPCNDQVDTAFHWLRDETMPFPAERFFTESAIFGRSINPGYMKPLFRGDFVREHGLRYDRAFRSGQDYLLYADAFAHAPRCYATGYCGYLYRRRIGSLSRSGGMHLRNHARLSDEIIRRHGARLSPASIAALRSRQGYFLRAAALHDVRVALTDRKPVAALLALLRQPQAILGGIAAVRRSYLFRKARG